MHALIIHAHSEADSFVAAMKEVIKEELSAQGAEVTISDLYAMNFNPVLSPNDFTSRENPEHLVYALEQRQGYAQKTLAPDIAEEVEKVLKADLLVFTFPLYWFSIPAILKGWIERTFLSGPFYGGKRVYGQGGLRGKKAFAALSLGARPHMFGPDALHGELTTGMLRHFFQGMLGYVGLTVYEPFIAYHVPYLEEAARKRILEDLRAVVKDLAHRPSIPMPDLNNFDDKFRPKTI